MSPRDWDAATYDRVSDPQFEWALDVLGRLELRGDEAVLDAGCGSGRVTGVLVERVPRGTVIAVDAAPSMVELARRALAGRATVLRCDLLDLDLDERVDAVFSNAVFHWIADHDRLFQRLHDALRPGGQLIAQCGGKGNVSRVHAIAAAAAATEPFRPHFADFEGPWNFRSPQETRQSLERAGFTRVATWLEPRPARPAEPLAFIRTVCLCPFLERLPAPLHEAFAHAVADGIGDPVEIDYVRLNISARRGE